MHNFLAITAQELRPVFFLAHMLVWSWDMHPLAGLQNTLCLQVGQ
ncbi:hypothetical protein TRL7639_00471 [Falsiruegeria litorea R37]|uniref:Uncharacterized protein n=1 Tax=Falsiruegeria litorea R37 TaxID=1200284 RepID=A0A1Y5RPZ5_9RHOB|nr:hypothetical protein TRL7639_00471 [Falsiruegeria litorea R37]